MNVGCKTLHIFIGCRESVLLNEIGQLLFAFDNAKIGCYYE